MGNLLNILGLITLFLIIVCLSFIFVEVILRIFSALREKFFYQPVHRKDFIDKGCHPYVDWVENLSVPMFKYLPIGIRFFNDENTFLRNCAKNNSVGFRTYEFTKKKEDELRIVFLGGSAAWGCGSSSNETNITGHLEKMINDKKTFLRNKTHCKVFNLAQVNGTQTQDILSLIFYANELEPDYVITYTGWNELITNYGMDENLVKKHKVFYIEEMGGWEPTQLPIIKKKVIKKFFFDLFLSNFKIIKFFLKTNSKKKFNISDRISKNLKPYSSIVVRNFKIIENISKSFNFEVIHFLQPNIYRKSFLSKTENKAVELYEKFRPVHGGKKFGNYLKNTDIYKFICDDISNTYINVINLLDFFNGEKKTIFYNLVHLNDLGYKLVAEEIYVNLLKNMKSLN